VADIDNGVSENLEIRHEWLAQIHVHILWLDFFFPNTCQLKTHHGMKDSKASNCSPSTAPGKSNYQPDVSSIWTLVSES
jgi:hypothetical protein